MSIKLYRYFGGLMNIQEDWLNKMANRGYRLVRTTKMMYEFENCEPDKFQYKIEFIGQNSADKSADYRNFLEDMGYKVFFKNINLNYSIGKIRYRPWAEKGGRIATNSTTLNRELLIVEKQNDGKSFELHTTAADRAKYYAYIRNAWLCVTAIFGIGAVWVRSVVFCVFALIFAIPVVAYEIQICKCKHDTSIQE